MACQPTVRSSTSMSHIKIQGSAGRPLLMLSGLSAGTFGDCQARPPLRSGSVVLVLSGTLVAQRGQAFASRRARSRRYARAL